MQSYRRFLQLVGRILSVLALVMLVLIVIWVISTQSGRWIDDLHTVTIFKEGTGEVGLSTPTVEPEDFLPLVGIILILGLGLVGVRATWRSRPLVVLAAGSVLAVIAFVSSWTIGLLFVPPAFLLLVAAGALAMSGKRNGRFENPDGSTEMYGMSSADAFTYYLVPEDAWPLDLGDPGVMAPVQSAE